VRTTLPRERCTPSGWSKSPPAAGLVFEGNQTFGKVADNLEADEWVLAVAKGRSDVRGWRPGNRWCLPSDDPGNTWLTDDGRHRPTQPHLRRPRRSHEACDPCPSGRWTGQRRRPRGTVRHEFCGSLETHPCPWRARGWSPEDAMRSIVRQHSMPRGHRPAGYAPAGH